MVRFQTMVKVGGGGSSPVLPPTWDPDANIFIKYKKFTRYDHATLPFWDPFVEYCENENPNLTLTDYENIIANGFSNVEISQIGITRLKNDALVDELFPATYSVNTDFTQGSSVDWSSGNDDMNFYCFYYIYEKKSNVLYSDNLRLLKLRKEIESHNLYQDDSLQYYTNRNITGGYYAGAVIAPSSSTVDEFKIGGNYNLHNVQECTPYSYAAYFNFWGYYDFFKYSAIGNSGTPFQHYTGKVKVMKDSDGTRDDNLRVPTAAVLDVDDLLVFDPQDNSGKTIRAHYMVVCCHKTITERNILI